MHASTDVRGAIFEQADLRGADLSGVVGLTADQISRAIVDDATILPAYLQAAPDAL